TAGADDLSTAGVVVGATATSRLGCCCFTPNHQPANRARPTSPANINAAIAPLATNNHILLFFCSASREPDSDSDLGTGSCSTTFRECSSGCCPANRDADCDADGMCADTGFVRSFSEIFPRA